MGDEVLVHLVGTTLPDADVFFLDTGYHFAETLGTRDAYEADAADPRSDVLPLLTVAAAGRGVRREAARPRPRPVLRDAQGRAAERALSDPPGLGHRHAPRRRPDAHRHRDRRLGRRARHGQGQPHRRPGPTTTWTATSHEHGVFLNPLRQDGYASIGCAPCTRPVAEGEDPRAGRWAGQDKTECGLHT